MTTNDTIPDLETARRECEPACFSALGKLALHGFAVQPADVEPLIQDFFNDSWDNVRANFDPKRGSLSAYVYGAFWNYARHQIIRQQRWPLRLADLDAVADRYSAHESPLHQMVHQEEAAALSRALAELPSEQRERLLEFFAAGPRSHRELSRRHRVSRRQVKNTLIEAFARLVVRLGEGEGWPPSDWEVAHARWYEGRTPEETAAYLERPLEEVRAVMKRLTERFAAALAGTSKVPLPVPTS